MKSRVFNRAIALAALMIPALSTPVQATPNSPPLLVNMYSGYSYNTSTYQLDITTGQNMTIGTDYNDDPQDYTWMHDVEVMIQWADSSHGIINNASGQPYTFAYVFQSNGWELTSQAYRAYPSVSMPSFLNALGSKPAGAEYARFVLTNASGYMLDALARWDSYTMDCYDYTGTDPNIVWSWKWVAL